jgi:AraC-like DNA-binding protein
MDKIKAQQLHDEILQKVAEYYKLTHKTTQEAPFVPGESRVNYAGRVFDEKEMCNLVDSSLEFWLTYGRYSREFEKKLAEYLQVRFALLVNSGSSANLLAFSALTSPLLKDRQIKRGDEVITVACGFPTTIAPIIQYVWEHLEEHVTAESTAQALYMSISRLDKLIKLYNGTGFRELRISLRMKRAKELLRSIHYRIEEVAQKVGYKNYASFYRAFVREFNMTPMEYRYSLSKDAPNEEADHEGS